VTSDRGGIVLGWLTKLIVVLSITGLVGFDLVSLGASRLQAEDHAQTAARTAAEAYSGPKDLQAAYEAALAEVVADGDTIDPQTFGFAPDGTVTLTLHRTAPTLLVHKVSALRDYTEVQRTVTRRRSS
jgi:hypothetical protein